MLRALRNTGLISWDYAGIFQFGSEIQCIVASFSCLITAQSCSHAESCEDYVTLLSAHGGLYGKSIVSSKLWKKIDYNMYPLTVEPY